MGKFNISSYLSWLLPALFLSCFLSPLMQRGNKLVSAFSIWMWDRRVAEVFHFFSFPKMVDRKGCFFSFFSFPPLSCIAQWQKGEFPPIEERDGLSSFGCTELTWMKECPYATSQCLKAVEKVLQFSGEIQIHLCRRISQTLFHIPISPENRVLHLRLWLCSWPQWDLALKVCAHTQ